MVYKWFPNATRFQKVPSGSKSSGDGLATGLLARNVLRSASIVHVPLTTSTSITPLGVPETPWEQPAPASKAYIVDPTKAISATPLTSDPCALLVWLDGRLSTIVDRACNSPMREMRAVLPPVYGPTGATTCGHIPVVEAVPPVPPSAT